MRFVRAAGHRYDVDCFRALLARYGRSIGMNYVGGGSPASTPTRVWKQVFDGYVRPFAKGESDINLTAGARKALACFIAGANIQSKAQRVALAGAA